MAELELGQGDRIPIILPNRPESIVALLACARLGAMVVPVNSRLSYHELEYQFRRVDALAAFAVGQYDGIDEGRCFAESPSAGDGSDLALLSMSGTAGKPKGVCPSRAREAARFVEAEWVAVLHGVPTMFHLLMRNATFNPSRHRTLRSGITAGGFVSGDVADRVREWCDAGIAVRGPNVMPGCARMPAEPRRSFTPEGFSLTGDPGIIDEDGYVRIVGCCRETIPRGGYKVPALVRFFEEFPMTGSTT